MKSILFIISFLIWIGGFGQEMSSETFKSEETVNLMVFLIQEEEESVAGKVIKSRNGWKVGLAETDSFETLKPCYSTKGRNLKKVLNKSINYMVETSKGNYFEYRYLVKQKRNKWLVRIYQN